SCELCPTADRTIEPPGPAVILLACGAGGQAVMDGQYRYGSGVLGRLDQAATLEWLVPDGLGGYAMGTAAGLRTRRYHGLLVVAAPTPARRMMALASLDPIVTNATGTNATSTNTTSTATTGTDAARDIRLYT